MNLKIIVLILTLANRCYVLKITPDELYISPGNYGIVSADTTVQCVFMVEKNYFEGNYITTQSLTRAHDRLYRFLVSKDAPAGFRTTCYLRCNGDECPIKIHIVEALSAVGDPHFMQIVKDEKTGNSEYICYDVSGTPGSYIHIASYSQLKVQIFGNLLNDFYMHKIIVLIEGHRIIVDYDSYNFDRRNFTWTSSTKKVKKSKIVLRTQGHILSITYLLKRPLKFSITRNIRHEVQLKHLDIHLSTTNGLDDGLLGFSYKLKYEFYPPVQYDSNYGTVMIGSKFVQAKQTVRNHQKCWLLKTQDIVDLNTYLLERI